MSNQDELIAQFIEISGGDESVARFYLSSSNWSLETALSNFLGNQSENDVDTDNEAMNTPNYPATGSDSEGRTNDGDDFVGSGSRKPKFGTLKTMVKQSSNEEEGQAFYAGGSDRSGQQVLGPPKRKNFREQLTDMFRLAQEQNNPDAMPAPSTSGGAWGQGMRLGMTNNDHSVVGQKDENKEEKKPRVVLKLWRQGFSINDNELRPYDDPENKEFLETVMRGEIPHELLEMGWMVNVDVEDHRHEDFKKVSTVKTFKGSGHTLGSPAPNVVPSESKAQPSTSKTSTNAVDDEKIAKEKLNVDSSEPTTTLQIRLSDGSRLTAQFNLAHTVADVHQYIERARPDYANRDFILVSSFPTRELTDYQSTIETAGLKNAALMQRLK